MQETEFVDGKEHGQERWWYEDGARAGQCSYRDGLLDGPCLHWHPMGIRRNCRWSIAGGEGMAELVWFANGKEKSSARFELGKQEGNPRDGMKTEPRHGFPVGKTGRKTVSVLSFIAMAIRNPSASLRQDK